ncbi:hypothetical protein BGX38DRAFT_1146441 [Terfezia claveryi]|nr:hypothetical protein BGX38DRAFT_1146441 [Terfezia claveryi]
MPSPGHINVPHVDHEYNKCQCRAISLEHHSACPLKEKKKKGTQAEEVYDIVVEEEKTADDEGTHSLGDVVQCNKPLPTEELSATAIPKQNTPPTSTLCNKEDTIDRAWKNYRQHRVLHWSVCNDYYCSAHGSDLQMKNRYPQYNSCSICGGDHYSLHCELAKDVLEKEKEYRKQNRNTWNRNAETN